MTISWKRAAPRMTFITGGGSGIGREFARRLAAEGSSVVVFNRRPADDVVRQLRAAAVRPDQKFAYYCVDVADADALVVAFAQAAQEQGAPDLAINSAGIQCAHPFRELARADFERLIRVNLLGSRNFAEAALPHLRPGSQIVFVASLAALTGTYAYTAYCASKYGVRGFVEALRYELKLEDIDVSLCMPGEVITPMVEAERKTLHPISAALKEFAGHQEVEVSVGQMLPRIARRHFEIVDGPKPRITAWLVQHVPGLMRRIADAIAAKAAKAMRRQ